MKVSLKSTYGDLNFKGINERGQVVQFGGAKMAVSPMETVLMSIAACSSIDIELLLGKMRQQLDHIVVEVEGNRVEDVPAVFDKIHLHYILYGTIKAEKAKKVVDMSVEKYCSVSTMLQNSVAISHSHEIRTIDSQ